MTADKTGTLALVLVCLLALTACEDRDDAGRIRSEARDLGAFDSIEMEGAARIEITVGGPHAVVVEGRDRVIGRVETRVRGETLHIESKPKDWFISDGRPRITLRISLPRLESLRLEGGNDVRLDGFDGGESKIRLAGATHMKASGRLDELTLHMAGAGHADFSKLIADETKVTLDGVGSVIVHPKDTLDATMNGVGAILYTGRPREVNTRMNGLGTIGRRDPKDTQPEDDAPYIDPDTLQPEYEDAQPTSSDDSTEVI